MDPATGDTLGCLPLSSGKGPAQSGVDDAHGDEERAHQGELVHTVHGGRDAGTADRMTDDPPSGGWGGGLESGATARHINSPDPEGWPQTCEWGPNSAATGITEARISLGAMGEQEDGRVRPDRFALPRLRPRRWAVGVDKPVQCGEVPSQRILGIGRHRAGAVGVGGKEAFPIWSRGLGQNSLSLLHVAPCKLPLLLLLFFGGCGWKIPTENGALDPGGKINSRGGNDDTKCRENAL